MGYHWVLLQVVTILVTIIRADLNCRRAVYESDVSLGTYGRNRKDLGDETGTGRQNFSDYAR